MENRCNLLFNNKNDFSGDDIMSSHKKSLILTVQYYYERAGDFPNKYKKQFDKPIQNILNSTVKQIYNWISLTKNIFKANKTYRIEHNKITNYFHNEENITTTIQTIPQENIHTMGNRKQLNNKDKELGTNTQDISDAEYHNIQNTTIIQLDSNSNDDTQVHSTMIGRNPQVIESNQLNNTDIGIRIPRNNSQSIVVNYVSIETMKTITDRSTETLENNTNRNNNKQNQAVPSDIVRSKIMYKEISPTTTTVYNNNKYNINLKILI